MHRRDDNYSSLHYKPLAEKRDDDIHWKHLERGFYRQGVQFTKFQRRAIFCPHRMGAKRRGSTRKQAGSTPSRDAPSDAAHTRIVVTNNSIDSTTKPATLILRSRSSTDCMSCWDPQIPFVQKAIDRSIRYYTKAAEAISRPYLVVLGPDRA